MYCPQCMTERPGGPCGRCGGPTLDCGVDSLCPTCDPIRTSSETLRDAEALADDYRRSRDLAIASQERARLAAKMRTRYPQNRHALEWADWIERESTK